MNTFNWYLDESRFLSATEVSRLRRKAKERAGSGRKSDVRDWLIIDLALCTGLRLSEIVNLKCGDIMIRDNYGSLLVRRGKGGKSRAVCFGRSLKKHLAGYFRWKKYVREDISQEDHLLISDRTGNALTGRAIQKTFFRCASLSGIHGHRFHDLRHTYASHLYKASGYNLRLVQKQLGHSSIAITQVYADVLDSDLKKALNKLFE